MTASPPAVDQPLGPPLPGWRPPAVPGGTVLAGRWVTLEPLAAAHAEELWAATAGDDALWTYLPYGPFASRDELAAHVATLAADADVVPYAIRPTDGAVAGLLGYLRIEPPHGTIEVGHVTLSRRLRRSAAATEAQYLLARQAFELGYRRYEWKANALNAASLAAARRLGFTPEGVWRNHRVVKGRSRDTAWFAMTDDDWALLRPAFEAWLDPAGFDADGRTAARLSVLTAAALAGR